MVYIYMLYGMYICNYCQLGFSNYEILATPSLSFFQNARLLGQQLEFASQEFQNDDEVVLEAISQECHLHGKDGIFCSSYVRVMYVKNTHVHICTYVSPRTQIHTHNMYIYIFKPVYTSIYIISICSCVVYIHICLQISSLRKKTYKAQPFLLGIWSWSQFLSRDDAGCISSALGQQSTSFFQGIGHGLGRHGFVPTCWNEIDSLGGAAKTVGTQWGK